MFDLFTDELFVVVSKRSDVLKIDEYWLLLIGPLNWLGSIWFDLRWDWTRKEVVVNKIGANFFFFFWKKKFFYDFYRCINTI